MHPTTIANNISPQGTLERVKNRSRATTANVQKTKRNARVKQSVRNAKTELCRQSNERMEHKLVKYGQQQNWKY